jgi:hypothetical protein
MRQIQAVLWCLTTVLVAPSGLAQQPSLEGVSPADWANVETWISERFPEAVVLSTGLFPMTPPPARTEVPQSSSPRLDELLTRVPQDRPQAVGVIIKLPSGVLRTLRFHHRGGELVPENPLIDP